MKCVHIKLLFSVQLREGLLLVMQIKNSGSAETRATVIGCSHAAVDKYSANGGTFHLPRSPSQDLKSA